MNEFSCSPNRRKERVGRHCFLPFQARRSYVPLLPTQLVSMYPSTKLSAYMQHRASSVNILTQSLVCTHDTEPHPHTHDTEPCLHTRHRALSAHTWHRDSSAHIPTHSIIHNIPHRALSVHIWHRASSMNIMTQTLICVPYLCASSVHTPMHSLLCTILTCGLNGLHCSQCTIVLYRSSNLKGISEKKSTFV